MSDSIKFFLAELPAGPELGLYEAIVSALLRASELGDEVPASEACIDSLFAAARECGVRVFGSVALHDALLDSLIDAGIGCGAEAGADVCAGLSVLAEAEVLGLGRRALGALSALGFCEGLAAFAGLLPVPRVA